MDYRKEAKENLTGLRRNPEDWMLFHYRMTQAVEMGGLSLADIGTNEQELKQLRVEWCKFFASRYLTRLREGEMKFVPYFRHAVREAGLSFADFGATEEEITFFTQRRIKSVQEGTFLIRAAQRRRKFVKRHPR